MGILSLTAPALPFACGDVPYMGGDCATTDDCLSSKQTVPGTV
ncbi:hypothetical protein ACSRUE_43905 [Sorangium sp. KYC3313]